MRGQQNFKFRTTVDPIKISIFLYNHFAVLYKFNNIGIVIYDFT